MFCFIMAGMGLIKLIFLMLLLTTALFSVDILKFVPVQTNVLALTIDDGPHPQVTPQILRLLKEENIKATFFLIAKEAQMYPNLTKDIIAQGHEIGNHSFSHQNFQKISLFDVSQSIEISQAIFKQLLGKKPYYFRAPYGRMNLYQQPLIDRYFTNIVGWSVDSRDWEEPHNKLKTVDHVLDSIFPGSILLCHQRDKKRVETLKLLIQKVKARGYNFVTITNLLTVTNSIALSKEN